jgi:hypothetical protein
MEPQVNPTVADDTVVSSEEVITAPEVVEEETVEAEAPADETVA